jgi:hypothetical protein
LHQIGTFVFPKLSLKACASRIVWGVLQQESYFAVTWRSGFVINIIKAILPVKFQIDIVKALVG